MKILLVEDDTALHHALRELLHREKYKEGYPMEILRAEGLSKIYQTGANSVYALNEVLLSLDDGSFTAITGPSGSGKSTLLHLLSGLDKPTRGKVFYRDKDLYGYNDNQLSVLRRRRFGFVFQSYNLVKELTG